MVKTIYEQYEYFCKEVCCNKEEGKKYGYQVSPCNHCVTETFADWLDDLTENIKHRELLPVKIKHKKGDEAGIITCPSCETRTIINLELYEHNYEKWYCKRCGQGMYKIKQNDEVADINVGKVVE